MRYLLFISILVLLILPPSVFAQREYESKLAYRDDIEYLKKLDSNSEIEKLIERLQEVDSKTTLEFETFYKDSDELEKLQSDIRDFLIPREASYSNASIERDIKKYLLKYRDILFVECVNLQNDEWKISKGGTYKYYEFDAVCKNVINFYILINGYYKVDLTGKRSKTPRVHVHYKRTITYKNEIHRHIRR
ncbi:MAG: hypothetical protein C0596_05565 [Marinilabiliales bacterium]|nr:MAG: hypothetical protein C0596_05565 [Marinilabiliales bacterium]